MTTIRWCATLTTAACLTVATAACLHAQNVTDLAKASQNPVADLR